MLNEQQQKAVNSIDGNVLIVAGAGSGKTTTLVERYKKLLEKTTADKILMVTFTNKAAEEMKERIARHVPKGSLRGSWINNFHKVCMRMLREDGERIGIQKNFRVANDSDVDWIIGGLLMKRGLYNKYAKKEDEFSKYMVRHVIGALKAVLIDADTYVAEEKIFSEMKDQDLDSLLINIQKDTPELYKALKDIYPAYQEKLREENKLDMDDILLEAVRLLEKCPDIRRKYQDKFNYIQVDEVQDTNAVQFAFLALLAKDNLCCVGDDFQSIYGFRGSDIRNMLSFKTRFAPVSIIKLEQNYRSSKRIIEIANTSIAHNEKQLKKTLFTENPQGDRVKFAHLKTEYDEIEGIIKKIKSLHQQNYDYKDIAIIYRNNNQSVQLTKRLYEEKIPFEQIGEQPFLEREEILDMFAYLRVISDERDFASFRRIATKPKRGFKFKELMRLLNDPKSTITETLRFHEKEVKTMDWLNYLQSFTLHNATISKKLRWIKDTSNYMEYQKSKNLWKQENALEHINELIRLADELEKQFPGMNIDEFYQYIEQIYIEVNKFNHVNLLTVHKSKGLEFPVVFVAGLDDHTFPNVNNEDSLEEERRIFYVALTRAKEKLFLSAPKSKRNKDLIQEKVDLSPFIYEVLQHLK